MNHVAEAGPDGLCIHCGRPTADMAPAGSSPKVEHKRGRILGKSYPVERDLGIHLDPMAKLECPDCGAPLQLVDNDADIGQVWRCPWTTLDRWAAKSEPTHGFGVLACTWPRGTRAPAAAEAFR